MLNHPTDQASFPLIQILHTRRSDGKAGEIGWVLEGFRTETGNSVYLLMQDVLRRRRKLEAKKGGWNFATLVNDHLIFLLIQANRIQRTG
jgi:hypothetical protein